MVHRVFDAAPVPGTLLLCYPYAFPDEIEIMDTMDPR
jgi:hypothetical protein